MHGVLKLMGIFNFIRILDIDKVFYSYWIGQGAIFSFFSALIDLMYKVVYTSGEFSHYALHL